MSRFPFPAPRSLGRAGAAAFALTLAVGSLSAAAMASSSPPKLSPIATAAASGPGTNWGFGVSCATETDCVAVGMSSTILGTATTTADAGQSWRPVATVDAPFISRLQSVFCNTATTCVAVGESTGHPGVAVVATLKGSTWSWSVPHTIAAATNPTKDSVLLSGVSCANTLSCVAVGRDQTAATTVMTYSLDGGSTWTPAVTVGGDGATGAGYQNELNAIECPSATTCIAVGGDSAGNGMVATAVFNNSVWTFGSSADLVTGVSSNSGQLSAISCPTSVRCVAVGSDRSGHGVVSLGYFISGTGWIWTNESDVTSDASGVGSLTAVRCEAAVDCVAVGQDSSGIVTTISVDTGANWTTQAPVASSAGKPLLNAITCVSVNACLGVGQSNTAGPGDDFLVTTSANGGSSWHEPGLVASAVPRWASLFGISCPTLSHCVSTGYEYGSRSYSTVSDTGGASWRKETVMPNVSTVVANYDSVSCASASVCVAVGSTATNLPVATRSTTGGRSWSTPVLVTPDASGTGTLRSVSCPSATLCVAVGSNNHNVKVFAVSHTGGRSWGGEKAVTDPAYAGGEFASVSCPSVSRCVGVGTNGSDQPSAMVSLDGGASWKGAALPATTIIFYAVSCPTPTRCVAMGNYDDTNPVVAISSNGGLSWGAPKILPSKLGGGGYFVGGACSSPHVCVAVGVDNEDVGIYSYSQNLGASWSAPQRVSSSSIGFTIFEGVSCSGALRCVMVGSGSGMTAATSTLRFAATVHFAAHGGHGTMAAQVADAPTQLRAVSFARAGYRFAGWATSPGGAVRYTNRGRFPFDESVTLYAVWRAL